MQILNAFDAAAIVLTLCFSFYNLYKFMAHAQMRNFFTIMFYVLVFFCLASWAITAVAQTVDPTTRYLVYQLRDNPKYFHDTADLS